MYVELSQTLFVNVFSRYQAPVAPAVKPDAGRDFREQIQSIVDVLLNSYVDVNKDSVHGEQHLDPDRVSAHKSNLYFSNSC